jgi:hypothetical protein
MPKLVLIATLMFFIAGQTPTTMAQSSPAGWNAGAENDRKFDFSRLPVLEPEAEASMPEVCSHPEQVVATMAGGYIAFVSASLIEPRAAEWPAEQMKEMERIYGEVIFAGYAGSKGFGSLEAWARAFGVTQVPAACPGPDCCNAGGALRFMFVSGAVNKAGWYDYPGLARVPAVQTGCPILDCPATDVAYHELAHLWDFRGDGTLSTALDRAMGVVRTADRGVDVDTYYGRKPSEAYLPTGKPPILRHGDFASTYFNSIHPAQPAGGEHFAESVAAYFLIEQGGDYDYAVCWSDEDPRCPPEQSYEYDRYDFIQEVFRSAIAGDDSGARSGDE